MDHSTVYTFFIIIIIFFYVLYLTNLNGLLTN